MILEVTAWLVRQNASLAPRATFASSRHLCQQYAVKDFTVRQVRLSVRSVQRVISAWLGQRARLSVMPVHTPSLKHGSASTAPQDITVPQVPAHQSFAQMGPTRRTDSLSASHVPRAPTVLRGPLHTPCVQPLPIAQRLINMSASRVPLVTIAKSDQLIPRHALLGITAPQVRVSAPSVLQATRV